MTPESLNFYYGDAVTYVGLVGICGTLFILVAVFRSFAKSPLRK